MIRKIKQHQQREYPVKALTGYCAVWTFAFLSVIFLLNGVAFAQGGTTAVLEAVDVGSLPGGRVQLRFQMSGPVTEPGSFTINEPARIVLDFVGTQNGLSANQQTINQGVAERVTVLEGNDRTRASINLARLVPYSVQAQGNIVLLTLEAGGSASTAAATTSTQSQLEPALTVQRTINAIDFRRGIQGQGVINIDLSDTSITVDVREEGDKIVADFIGAVLPRGQERRLDVTDFATPVTLIDAVNRDGSARISISRIGTSEFLAYQTDDHYTIEVKPTVAEREEIEDPTRQEFTGELLSLNFQDIEVRAVLQIIADFTGLNVVVSDTVQGNLTLRLQNVPWDQALDMILRTKGLTMRQNGNVIYIAPAEEIAAREKLELEAVKQREELTPLRSDIIQVNYAKAEELQALIKERSSSGDQVAGGDSSSLLSARGQISADPRTNKLLVQDVPEKLTEIRELVSQLDIPVRQVMIDARIVLARDDFSKDLGVNFGGSFVRRNGDYGVSSIAGSSSGTDAIVNSAATNLQDTGQAFPVAIPALGDRLGVNLLGAGPSLAFAILGQNYLLDLELSALQIEGRGETLSNPRVITTDRKEAVIQQGEEIPFQTVSEGGTQTEFRDAVLELKVTPQITPDGRVLLDLAVKKDERGQETDAGPAINKREVTTQVLVNNGETVVLGGVFEKVSNTDVSKVPFLGDLPAIGRLFRRNQNINQKFELLIFVTPQIIKDGVAVR